MRALLWIISLGALLWCGYWVIGSRGARAGAETALAQMAAEGRVDYGSVQTSGFPYRFDLTVAPLTLRLADGRVVWQMPELRAYALAYQPNRLIAVWPERQKLTLAGVEFDLTADQMRASAALGALRSLPLDRAIFVADGLRLAGSAGPALSADALRLAAQAATPDRLVQEVGVEVTGLALPPQVAAQFGGLPPAIDRLHMDGLLGLDRPVDRAALEQPPRPQSLDLRDLSLSWGPASLTASGRLDIGRDGVLEGKLDLRASRWGEILDLAAAAGLVQPEIAQTYRRALERLGEATGSAEGELTVPLTFSKGWMSLGPLPLGLAPRI